jgi:acetyl-CoA carboxylase carboxyltransferase component
MRISVERSVSESEAKVIATAIKAHLGEEVEIAMRGDEDPIIRTGSGSEWTEGEVVTEREQQLREEIESILNGGPDRGHEKIKELGKLFVRDRLDMMFDDILYEDGTFARYDADENLAADAVITGCGLINGRKVFFVANDYTVKAGTRSTMSIEKQLRIQERAAEVGAPILFLIDSAGGRITDQSGLFADRYRGGKHFLYQSQFSGKVPQIAVLYGPSVAGAAYVPVFCDYLVMVEGTSAMTIASPRMVEMVIGEETEMAELGGPEMHATESGSVDLVVSGEATAADVTRRILSYQPQNHTDSPPETDGFQPARNPASSDHVIPSDPNAPYDVIELIDHVVDDGTWLELKPRYARELVTGLARLDGHPVGVIANQPAHKGGAIYPDSSNKAADFIWKCDAFGIPLLYLCDTPGFMVGKQVERDAILQNGRKFIYTTSCATVPKLSVIVRKAYGAGIYAMCGPAFEPDTTLGLPSSEIAVMGPKAAVNAVYANEIDAIDDAEEREAFIAQKRAEYREDIDIRDQAAKMVVDELIPAGDLRGELVSRLEVIKTKEKRLPDRKHGAIIF